MRVRRLKKTKHSALETKRYPGFVGMGAMLVAVCMMASMVGISQAGTTWPQTVSLSSNGDYDSGHFGDVWDLTAGDITISFTYDANGMDDSLGRYWEPVDPANPGGAWKIHEPSAHAWAELGVRSESIEQDWSPYGSVTVKWYSEKSYDLLADQDLDIGDVLVKRVGDTLFVTFKITLADWYMTETHVAVSDNAATLPQKNGNAVPGRFPYIAKHSPPVDEKQYVIDVSAYPEYATFYIAAHAAVIHAPAVCVDVVSDGTVQWLDLDGTWKPAVACYKHPSWPMQEATWIWRTALTDPQYEYANVPDGGWQFMKELTPAGAFDISAGSIYVGADNSEAVYVNGDLILQDGSLDKTGSNPVSPYVDNQEWKTIESADISGSLVDGQNTLVIKALNYFDSTHHPNVAYDYGDGMKNPAGLVFKVHVCYHLLADRMESAWGSGPGFPGKDWSMYMVYAPDETTVQGSGVWLATDYEGHPGTFSSDVTENGVPEPSQDLDDKLILQARGGYDERYYNDPLSPTGHPQMWQANHGIWYDRDGVDQWQAASWGFKGDNLGCKETLGIYHVVITLHADTLTTGTASMTVNGVHQGFYNSWSSPIPDVYPADLSWNGDMQHLVVFYGMYGYGLSDDVEPQWATFSGITVTQVSL